MTRERIEDFREVVLPFVKKRLLETNYEGLGKSDAEMFAKDFNEVLNLAIKALEQEPTTKNDLEVQKAIEIIKADSLASYSVNEILSARDLAVEALKQTTTIKNDLEVDCIDRAQAQTEIEMNALRYTLAKERGGMGQVEWSDQLIKVSDAVDIIRNLPPVTPQEPRKGHWILDEADNSITCDKCGCLIWANDISNGEAYYCPNCGADMREVEE